MLFGRVVRVSDGDTIRVRHTPIYPLIGELAYVPFPSPHLCIILPTSINPSTNTAASLGNTKDTGRLTEETLSIRLAGIDAPEVAKASASGQPFAQESKQFVVDKVLNKQGPSVHALRQSVLAFGPHGCMTLRRQSFH